MSETESVRMCVLVIRHNTDGRPCGWGLCHIDLKSDMTPTEAVKLARAEAEEQYKNHRCYPGEKRGRITSHWFDAHEEPSDE